MTVVHKTGLPSAKSEVAPLPMETPLSTIPPLVQEMREHFQSGLTQSVAYRKKQLRKLYEFLEKEEQGICEAVYQDLRKPTTETLFAEICGLKADIASCLNGLDQWMEPEKAHRPLAFITDRAETRKVPLGTVLIIGTWNYPVILTLGPLVAAIAGGNTAVLKWNEVCVHTSSFISKTLSKYVDSRCVVSVLGAVPETTKLLEERWGLIFYTGNTQVGKIIQHAAAKTLTPTVLELGGKSPVIVDDTVNLPVTAKRIMWSKILNCGQTCVAPDYVLVHKSVAKDLVKEMRLATEELVSANPVSSKGYGRIASDRHFSRLEGILQKQLQVPGAKLEFGGQTDASQRFMAPTVISGVGIDGTVHPTMSDEIFGPILPIIEVDSVDEAIKMVNTRQSPLAFYPYSRDSKVIEKVFEKVNGGNALANDGIVSLILDDLPFGGVGESGVGNYHGRFGFDTFTRKRATMIRTQMTDLINLPRYQNVSYEKGTFMYTVLIFLSTPFVPSEGWLMIRNA
ncbi:Aldehyde dehydrogenase, partial [Kappamyces sp. JEL0829]